MGRRGPAATWGRIGPNKEEQLSQAIKPATHQPPISRPAPHLAPHHAAHVPLFGTPTPLTQPPCARALFFLSFFLVFYLTLFILFLWFFLFLFSLVSFFTSFGQSKSRFCRFDVTDFVQSGRLNCLVFNTLKISDMTDFVQSKVQILSNRVTKIGQSLLSKRKWVTKSKHRITAVGFHHQV